MDISTVNNAVDQAFTSSNPGGVGTSYGQANSNLIGQAQSEHPELASALANGTASFATDGEGTPYLYNTQTGQQIGGNYQVTTTPSGGVAINLPLASGAMVQVATGLNQNGTVAPVSANNVYNVGLNSSEGGFAGGLSNLTPILSKAAMMYGSSVLGDYLNSPNMGSGQTLANLNTGITDAPIGDLGNLGSNSYAINPSTANLGQGLNATANLGSSVYDPFANTAGYNSTGLQNGLGLQAPGSANLASMGGGQGLTIPTATGASTVPNATLGANGVTPYGSGGLPVNPLTGQTLGTALNNIDTGVFTPTLTNIIPDPNVITKPPGTPPPPAPPGSTTSLLTPTNVLGASAVLNTLGTLGTNKAIANAAGTQATAGKNVQDVLGGFYDQYAKAQAPYQNLGTGATQAITQGAPYFTHQFGAQDLAAGLAPNYDFMLQQGQRANQNMANVGGGLLSGNTLQGLQNYTQNYAGNAYQNAFTNYQNQRNNIYNTLSNAAGMGQTSLGQLGQVGTGLANTYGNVTTGLAASQAGAQTAQAVNTNNLLSNLTNSALTASLLSPQPTKLA